MIKKILSFIFYALLIAQGLIFLSIFFTKSNTASLVELNLLSICLCVWVGYSCILGGFYPSKDFKKDIQSWGDDDEI